MCVIICVEKGNFPTLDTLKSAECTNSHGGAIAWLNKDGTRSYVKGIKAKKVWKIICNQLIPANVQTAIIHFRIASVGKVKPQLCHPFEITEDVKLNMKGQKIDTELLFHNGTWSEWAEYLIDFMKDMKVPIPIPKGDYSDSRVMAFLSFHLGHQVLSKMVGKQWNKIAILTSNGIVKYGNGWVKHEKNSCSNDHFLPNNTCYTYGDMWDTNGYREGSITGRLTRTGLSIDEEEIYPDMQPKDIAVVKRLVSKWNMDHDEIQELMDYGRSVYDIEVMKEEEDALMKSNSNVVSIPEWEREQERYDQEERARRLDD
jgi:hypothetical protein